MVCVAPGSLRFWVLLCVVLLLVAPALAQEPPVFELPEVVVPGRRPQSAGSTPASVTVITRADLERLGARTIADALRLVPEAMVRAYGGFGSLAEPSIRGFGPGQVLVLLDGVPLNNVALGQADLSTISTAGVERIEVLRGAFGAISGSGAVGGVINIVTARAEATAMQAQVGGYGERMVRASTGRQGLAISLESAGITGSRPNSDAATITAAGSVDLDGAVRLTVHHTRMELGTPGDVASPTPFDRQSLVRTMVQSQWGTAAGPLRARVYYVGERLAFSSSFGTSTYDTILTGGELQRQWVVASGRVIVGGLEIYHQHLDALVFGSAILRDATLGAAYLQYDAALSSRTLASVALRVDAHSAYGVTVNPRAGIVVNLDDQTRLRLSAGRTFRGPTFLHLYFPGCSDPALGPETAWTAEASVERSTGTRLGVLSVFMSEATDLISGGCPPQNIGAASIRGVSAEVRGRFTPALSGAFNVTVQQALDRSTGAPLPRVPGVLARTVVTYTPDPKSALTLLAEYVGARPDMDFSTFPPATVQLPPYVHLALRYQHQPASGWTVTLGVDNLLDASYEVVKGYPAPGRTVFINATKRY